MTIAGGNVDDLSAKLLEVEVRFRRPWMLNRQFYLCTITLAMLGAFVFPTEHISILHRQSVTSRLETSQYRDFFQFF